MKKLLSITGKGLIHNYHKKKNCQGTFFRGDNSESSNVKKDKMNEAVVFQRKIPDT